MKIYDEGFFLYSKNFGERSKILFILSRENGLIKGLTRSTGKKRINLINFDKINFSWSSRDQNALGYVDYEQLDSNSIDNYLFSIIKASASELCVKYLPLWEKNINIYEDIFNLSKINNEDKFFSIGKYINWEINFLKNLGYGLNINQCCVSNRYNDTFYISPKTGNAVSYEVGKKYSKKLFKIPFCMKDNFKKKFYDDYLDAMKITGHFFYKILDKKKVNFIFRNRLIEFIEKL